MENENLKKLLAVLTQTLEKNDFGADNQKIQYLSNQLEKFKKQIPTYNKLEELQKIVIDLEIEYDEFNDLSYYFDPMHVKIKNNMHAEDVKKLREENKRKRDMN